MPIVTFAHHKGGTGKTTSCLNIAGFLQKSGKDVLIVDIDPQANATAGLGIDPEQSGPSMYDVFMSQFTGYSRVEIGEVIHKTKSGIYIAPSSLELVGAEPYLYTVEDRAGILKKILDPIKTHYDFILVDTPPSMGQFVINGLIASDHTIVSFERGVFALQGLKTLLMIFSDIREMTGIVINADMAILARWDSNEKTEIPVEGGIRSFFSRIRGKKMSSPMKDEKLVREFEEEVTQHFTLIYTVPYSWEIIEAQKQGLPISHFAPECRAGKAYAGIAAVVQTWK